jgi:hypothetical protein
MDTAIREGQNYKSKSGDIYTVEYFNEDIVVFSDGSNYRLESKEYFRKAIDKRWFELKLNLRENDFEENTDGDDT